ncbi:hypothetical protein, partial [Sphingobacterium siyangense]|uniref:hypothetical protein n=1 Tax=Sphingobacterium siyangense TaxID=459529 RepID=UPI003DA50EC7
LNGILNPVRLLLNPSFFMIPSFEVTVPPLRSGAKIGRLLTNFQAFCSYLFHFALNCLERCEILFVKQVIGRLGWLIRLPDWAFTDPQVIIYSMEAGFASDLLPISFNFCS